MTKRIVSLICCVLLIVSSLLVSCAEDNQNDTSSAAVSTAGETSKSEVSEVEEVSQNSPYDPRYFTEDGEYSANYLPAFDESWKDYGEFRVLVISNEKETTYYSEEIEPLYDTTDTAIVDGVTTRNEWIADKYGITVKAVPTADIYNDILHEISGGLDTFDAAMPFMPSAATLARNGNLWNLNDFDFIDLNAPWWDANATESLSIGDKVYFTASDMTIMQKIVSSGIAFNKDLMAQYFPDFDIYQAVEDGTWTLDKLYSMSKEITRPLNDDDRMDEDDLWGIIDTGPSFYYGCGEQLINKDAENYPVIAIGADERSINAAVKVLEMSIEKKTWMCTTDDFTDRSNVWNEVVAVFGENRSLFIALHFSAVKKLRPYGVNYGIVPAAKYDEIQDDYFTKCSAAYAYGVCIPLSVKDPDFSAYMCDVMALGGKKYVSNTYYNVVLKGRDFEDEKSEKMLDIIFDGIVYDPAVVYGFSGLNTVISDLVKAGSTDIVSKLESIQSSVEASIDEIIEDYEAQ